MCPIELSARAARVPIPVHHDRTRIGTCDLRVLRGTGSLLVSGVLRRAGEQFVLTEWKSTGSNPGPRSFFRNPLVYTSTLVVIGALYVCGVFFFRWQSNRDADRRAAEKLAQEKMANAQRAYESLGGSQFAILNFYVTPSLIHPGESTQLCYGVSNAKEVRLDPPAGNVWPSAARCVSASPSKETTYTLTAVDAQGNTKTATLTVLVK